MAKRELLAFQSSSSFASAAARPQRAEVARLIALVSILACPFVSAAERDGDAWEALTSDDLTQVSSRVLPGSAVRELRITAVLKWPAARLIALIGDVDHYPSFMPPTEEAQSLGRSGATGRWYIVINPPLIQRRDYCVAITISRLPDGRLESRFGRSDEGCPEMKKGLVRMSRVEGRWTLTPRGDGATDVEYRAVTDPAGSVPSWMVNRAAGGSLREMFHALDRAAADPRISPCPGSSLGCVVAR
jgi:ribosome-associated toxin RatA of RatAB toxin-antitoxin module